ncbi:MAG: ABC transporter permease [Verrucomicrobia bacterium]|nr:ABC transporter permease [Kiritimatiellia bacterium]MCB1102533.1 ABC transporter permease [Kiritimatiellia bacterium]MCP5487495.1 ABC transporter permease [Verrucomicrobiota bacterium]
MSWVGLIGKKTRGRIASTLFLFGALASVAAHSVRPSYWNRTVRNVLARQILFTGVDATRLISLLAILIGASVVVQVQLWLTTFGQSALLGPVLVAVLVREAGPLLVNIAIIGRSGTAIATEIANMRVHGEIDLLHGQGIDPFLYLIVPRVLAAAVSIFCLTILFLVVSLLTGFAVGMLTETASGGLWEFIRSVMRALRPGDVVSLFLKTLIPGASMAILCSLEGMLVKGSYTEVPQAAARAVVKSTVALFLISLLVSVLTTI